MFVWGFYTKGIYQAVLKLESNNGQYADATMEFVFEMVKSMDIEILSYNYLKMIYFNSKVRTVLAFLKMPCSSIMN